MKRCGDYGTIRIKSNFEKGERMNGNLLKQYIATEEMVRIVLINDDAVIGNIIAFNEDILEVKTSHPQTVFINTNHILTIRKVGY